MSTSLQERLDGWAGSDPQRRAVAGTIVPLAVAAAELAAALAAPPLAVAGASLDGRAFDLFRTALAGAPVTVWSAAGAELQRVAAGPGIAVAGVPLDGQSDLALNEPGGTIFSLRAGADDESDSLMGPGTEQIAAGIFVYGPGTMLGLSLGNGVDLFALDRPTGAFMLSRAGIRMPEHSRPAAAAAAPGSVSALVDDRLSADDAVLPPASLAAATLRVLLRGELFTAPREGAIDSENRPLRLVHEAQPLAMLVEQAGGAASTGEARVLELRPAGLEAQVPVLLGPAAAVAEATAALHAPAGRRSPLFGRRGLFRT